MRAPPGRAPVFKTVDTCAGEFEARTPYHYSTYEDDTRCEPGDAPARGHPGRGPEPDRTGDRVRLRLRARRVRAAGGGVRDGDGELEPRDRLHRLRHQRPAVLRAASPSRTCWRCARPRTRRGDRPARRPDPAATWRRSWSARGFRSSARADAIDLAEDREQFVELLRTWASLAGARRGAHRPRRPRPWPTGSDSRSWSGPRTCWAAGPWTSCTRPTSSAAFVASAAAASPEHPVFLDRFLEGAVEVDVDAVCDGTRGLHGRGDGAHRGGRRALGDSSCVIPPPTLADGELDVIEDTVRRIALALGVRGP